MSFSGDASLLSRISESVGTDGGSRGPDGTMGSADMGAMVVTGTDGNPIVSVSWHARHRDALGPPAARACP